MGSDDAQRPIVEAVERGECLDCGYPLTDPAESPNGWAWCRNPRCRQPFKVWDQRGGRGTKKYVVT